MKNADLDKNAHLYHEWVIVDTDRAEVNVGPKVIVGSLKAMAWVISPVSFLMENGRLVPNDDYIDVVLDGSNPIRDTFVVKASDGDEASALAAGVLADGGELIRPIKVPVCDCAIANMN